MLKLLLLVLLSTPIGCVAQYKTTITTKVDTAKSGYIEQYQHIVTKSSKEFQLHTFYLKTDATVTRFYPDGNKKLVYRSIVKKGTYGRSCNEILFKQQEYYPNGKLKSSLSSHCDCHRIVERQYSSEGKLTFKQVQRNKRIRLPQTD